MLRGLAAITGKRGEPHSGQDGCHEISLAWEAPRSILPGKVSLLAIGGLTLAATVWWFGISNSASAVGEAWASLLPKWHVMRSATASSVNHETVEVAEPDAPAALAIAPLDGYLKAQPLPAAGSEQVLPQTAGTADHGSTLTIITSSALALVDDDRDIEARTEASPESEPARVTGGTAPRRSASAARPRRDTSWTGNFFER
jgi:hypothetical protein